MVDKRPTIAVIGGWGVSPQLLQPWVESLESFADTHIVEIPDLQAGKRLDTAQRSERLLASAPDGSYWLGWSLGGAIALDLASQAASAVKGVITLATNPCFVAQADWPGMASDTFTSFVHSYRDAPAKTLQRFASLQAGGSREPRAQLRDVKASLLEPQPLLAELLELLAVDRRALLATLEVPLLSLLADSDALVSAQLPVALKAEAALVDVYQVKGASHLLFQDQPLELKAAVQQWIEAKEAGEYA